MNLASQIVDAGLQLLEAAVTDGATGNISARLPDADTMLITPTARDYRRLEERDLVRVHLGSATVEGQWKPSSEWRLHAAIYRARRDVDAIIHHHGTWSCAVAVARKTIPVLIDEAAEIGPIRTASYAPSASQELAETVSRELAKGANAVLLANHGAVAVGRDIREAVRRALEVERFAKIYVGAELLGGAYALDEAEVVRSKEFFETYRTAPVESREFFPSVPPVVGPVGLQDIVKYSLRAGIVFVSLVYALILQKFHR